MTSSPHQAKRPFYCVATLTWFDSTPAGPFRQAATIQKVATFKQVVDVDPHSDRKQLADDVLAEAKRVMSAPADAAVMFLSLEPNEL
ncbi:hypothetical protein [Kitasatospora kifunensis]|uniref:Uncharacterized protein n=1 Tax=Kitasatospora kifunensis TaxID=58351 RepID=A0A7W7W001_KITKI|nr:hypothetical protein [Kitasatospora kifunensis]MBB4929086.1 hypothetical protein [Kitasatospora kifunensis]